MSIGEIRKRIEAITVQEHNELIRYIQGFAAYPSLAEDYLQEAYYEALKSANMIRNPDQLIPWLKTVAKRKALKEFNGYYRFAQSSWPLFHSDSLSAEDQWIAKIVITNYLRETMKRFPQRYQKIIFLHYEERKSFLQISREMGISVSAARQAHHRVIQELRKLIIKEQ